MKKGVITLIVGVVMIIAAVAVPLVVTASLAARTARAEPFLVPGTAAVSADTPGRYYLWNDYHANFQGRAYMRGSDLPDGMRIRIATPDGEELPFVADSSLTVSVQGTSSVSIGYVDVETPAKLSIEVNGLAEERVFSFGTFNLSGLVGKFLAAIGAALLLGVGGLVVVILGIVWVVKGASRRSPAA